MNNCGGVPNCGDFKLSSTMSSASTFLPSLHPAGLSRRFTVLCLVSDNSVGLSSVKCLRRPQEGQKQSDSTGLSSMNSVGIPAFLGICMVCQYLYALLFYLTRGSCHQVSKRFHWIIRCELSQPASSASAMSECNISCTSYGTSISS